MTDVWSTVATLDPETQERLAGVLETRAADLRQQEMRREFLSNVPFPEGARVVEVGCGTGALTRTLAAWPGVGQVVGVDPAPSLLIKARELSTEFSNIRYQEGDGRSLRFDGESFDAVVSIRPCAIFPGRRMRCLKPFGCCALADCWPSSMATTSPRPCP